MVEVVSALSDTQVAIPWLGNGARWEPLGVYECGMKKYLISSGTTHFELVANNLFVSRHFYSCNLHTDTSLELFISRWLLHSM